VPAISFETILISTYVQHVLRQVTNVLVAHFHEWQVGVAISLCRKRRTNVTTVFTTPCDTSGSRTVALENTLWKHIETRV
jgi:hypothetical protein